MSILARRRSNPDRTFSTSTTVGTPVRRGTPPPTSQPRFDGSRYKHAPNDGDSAFNVIGRQVESRRPLREHRTTPAGNNENERHSLGCVDRLTHPQINSLCRQLTVDPLASNSTRKRPTYRARHSKRAQAVTGVAAWPLGYSASSKRPCLLSGAG